MTFEVRVRIGPDYVARRDQDPDVRVEADVIHNGERHTIVRLFPPSIFRSRWDMAYEIVMRELERYMRKKESGE